MNNGKIIGVVGKKRSGKDSIADYLVKNYNYQRYSFAESMRQFACNVFGWTKEWIEKYKEDIDPFWGISYRQFMQHLGTDYMQFGLAKAFPQFEKITGREVWVKSFMQFRSKHPANYVLSDVRFSHEATMIKKNGGSLLHVERPSFDVLADPHLSEQEESTIPCDYYIHNMGKSLSGLYLEVDCVMEEIGIEQ
jgi:hypothetical protein